MGMLFRTALAGWWNDRAMSLGAAIAFFTVFSLAPMLLVAIAVAGLAFGREAAQGAIIDELGGLVGGQTGAALEGMIASAGNFESGVVGLAVGVATFLFLATGAVIDLEGQAARELRSRGLHPHADSEPHAHRRLRLPADGLARPRRGADAPRRLS
jgi:uncharacterized BrkB/YihY/UPF0761 family membrane protein